MALAWQKTDTFLSIWSAAKPSSERRLTAVGEYPADRRNTWRTAEPLLANVLRAKARRNETTLPVMSSALAPQSFPPPSVELLPSTEVRYPRSLTRWHLVQIEGQTWPGPDASTIWNVVVQRSVRTNFPEHELRGPKPRVWRRGLDAPNLTGLQSASMRTLSPELQRPAGPGNLGEFMSPTWREVHIRETADAARVEAANLTKTEALRHWLPYGTARSSVAPLGLLAPSFTVPVPDPKRLR